MPEGIEAKDLMRFVSVSDPQLSPDLERIAFVAVGIDEQRDDYSATIWVVSYASGEPLMYLSGGRDIWPRWSPDGRHLLFLSRRTLKEGERGNELWVTSTRGGEPRLVLRLEGGIEAPRWSPDGRRILFLSSVGEDDENVRVIRRIPLWFNGVGFTYFLRKHVFMVAVDSGDVTRLTDGEMDVVYAVFSNRGDRIAYVAATDDLNPRILDIYILDVKTGERVKLTRGNMTIGPVCWSPDDKYIAFRGSDLKRGYSSHETIWCVSVEGGEPENLTRSLDRNSSLRVYYDLRSPFTYLYSPVPVWEENYIYFPLSDSGRFNLYRINFENRKVEPVITGNFVIEDFSVRNGIVAYTKVTETEPAEVWVKDGEGDRRITSFNSALLSKLRLSVPERFEFKASDGETIEGWILKPPKPVKERGCPVILHVHGGPKSAFGYSFMFEHHFFASKGFAVVYPNPRGSDGYKEDFADIRGAYGTRDFQDIMELVGYITSKYSFIDPERMGITGISYGGFMTNWAVTQTDRFKAAISQNGISLWTSMFGTTDIGFHFVPDQIGRDPWSNEEGYRRMSPLTYAPNVKTPIMFIHSVEDYRCWIDQSIIFFTALKYLGKDAELVLFMKGEHVFSRTGKPRLRVKRLEHMLRWFKKYLMADE